MSAVPISQLPEISITDPNAYLVIVTSGTTYKITFSALTEQFVVNTVGNGYIPLSTGGTQYTPSLIYQTDSGTVVLNGQVKFDGVIEAEDNADAILSGLTTGDVYRTGDFLKIVH